MNDFVREFFEDQPELLRRYERNEARYILQLPKNYDTISIDFGIDTFLALTHWCGMEISIMSWDTQINISL